MSPAGNVQLADGHAIPEHAHMIMGWVGVDRIIDNGGHYMFSVVCNGAHDFASMSVVWNEDAWGMGIPHLCCPC